MSTGAEVPAAEGGPASAPVSSTRMRGAARGARVVALVAVAFVLAMVAARWDSVTGFTSLLRFGENYAARQIPAIDDLPLALKPASGYDGQFYGMMAVTPNTGDPALLAALDNPGYRLRRILLPGLAHVLGAGDAWRTLHIYAAVNVVAWLACAWLLWRILEPQTWRETAAWAGCVLGLGVLDSVRMALTDLPALVLTLAAVQLARQARPRSAAALLAVTALARETAILSVAALDSRSWTDRASWVGHLRRGFLVALPVAAWTIWLFGRVPSADPLGRANFDWPGAAIVEHGVRWISALAAGDFDSRHTFGLLAIVSFAWQSISLLRQGRSDSPWVRMALPFALLFWILGDAVWHGYWAVARACVPMTIAYNLTLPLDRSWSWRWALGNLCMFHGIWRFLPES